MAGTELMRIANLSRMEARVDVNENDIVKVNIGDTALVEVDAYLDRKFKGIVTPLLIQQGVKPQTAFFFRFLCIFVKIGSINELPNLILTNVTLTIISQTF